MNAYIIKVYFTDGSYGYYNGRWDYSTFVVRNYPNEATFFDTYDEAVDSYYKYVKNCQAHGDSRTVDGPRCTVVNVTVSGY